MIFEDIKIEYNMFTEYLYLSHGFVADILKDLRTYFEYYCKTLDYDKKFASIIEENLIFMEKVYYELDNLLEYLENINLLVLNEPMINNIINISDLVTDDNIYVDLNYPLDLPWNIIEKPKRNFDDLDI